MSIARTISPEISGVTHIRAQNNAELNQLQKAIRMLQVGMYGVVCNDITFQDLEKELNNDQ